MAGRRPKLAAVVVEGQTSSLYHDPPDIEHVPTVLELHGQGLAKYLPSGHYRLKPEGQALIYAAMKRNAERRRNHAGS